MFRGFRKLYQKRSRLRLKTFRKLLYSVESKKGVLKHESHKGDQASIGHELYRVEKKNLRFVHNNTYLLNKAKSGTQISLGSKCTRSTSSYWLAFHVRNSLFQFWKWQEIFQSWQSICQMVLSNFYHSGKYQRSIFSGKPNRARWAIKYLLPPNFPHTLQPPSTPPPLKKREWTGKPLLYQLILLKTQRS